MVVPMNTRSFLGYRIIICSMDLYPKDPNAKHDYVEKGTWMYDSNNEGNEDSYFVVRARRKDEGGKVVSHILRHLRDASSTEGLHHGVVDEGSSRTSSKTVVGEDYTDRDLTGIVDFCTST